MAEHGTGASSSQALAVAALFPIGGALLTLSALTLTATVISLTVSFPLFLLFSPVLIPAFVSLGLALAGFLASATIGLKAVTALSWVVGFVKRAVAPENVERVKRRMAEAAEHVGQRTEEVGQGIQNRAHEVGRT